MSMGFRLGVTELCGVKRGTLSVGEAVLLVLTVRAWKGVKGFKSRLEWPCEALGPYWEYLL